MRGKEINCYFCGDEATQIEEYVNTWNVRVECDLCKIYELSSEVLLYHFDEEMNSLCFTDENTGVRKELSQELKDKLSDFVRSNFNTETGIPVPINMEKFQAVTGKMFSTHNIDH